MRHQVLYSSRCLEASTLIGRQFGVSFHSNRPSIDPSVGSPSLLRGQFIVVLSLCIPGTPDHCSLRSEQPLIIQLDCLTVNKTVESVQMTPAGNLDLEISPSVAKT